MAEKAGDTIELNLPENIQQFYREKARMERKDLSDVLRIALLEHMDFLQNQSHKPSPGNDSVRGDYGNIDTPAVPY